MGCFGDMSTTNQTTNSLPSYLSNAAQQNVATASQFENTPFQAYTGQLTAPINQTQSNAFGLINSIAGSSNPYLSDIQDLYNQFSSAPAQSVSAPSILGPNSNVNSSTISDYMSPYVQAALQPTLQNIQRTGIQQQQALDAQSTMDGAYGDARSGIAQAEQMRNEQQNVANATGQAYQNAFNTAAGLRQQDIQTNLGAQTTNANFAEQALQRAITGGQALDSLDQSQVNRGLTTAQALANAGQTEQQTSQAADTANYQEFLRGQGWTQQQIAAVTSALAGTPHDTTSTTQQPNNSGWGILGSLGSALLPAIISDRRLKTDISVIGATFDGLPIYRFKYAGSDKWQIGLMAQDVEETNPAAVVEIKGVKLVDYGLATQGAAEIGVSV